MPGSVSSDVLADAGIGVVLSGVQTPRMNSIMKRWVQTCRHKLPGRTLIWNQAHLLHALREFEQFCNEHRPHQGIASARPIRPLIDRDSRMESLSIRALARRYGMYRSV
jgi:putative transposase